MNSFGENILQVSSLLIQQALDFPQSYNYTAFSDETLLFVYQNLLSDDRNKLHILILPPNAILPSESTQFPIVCFSESVSSILQVIVRIL